MTAKIISGREVAENILQDLKKRVDILKKKNITPKLVVVLVGDMKASASYVAQKEKFAVKACLLYTSPSPRDRDETRIPS